jgi:hypothetical protein
MLKAVRNWYTTGSGTLAAALLYWSSVGFKIPSTRQEAMTLCGSLALVLFGISAKDGAVGNGPGVSAS